MVSENYFHLVVLWMTLGNIFYETKWSIFGVKMAKIGKQLKNIHIQLKWKLTS